MRSVRSPTVLLSVVQVLASLAFSCGTDSGRGGSPSPAIIGSAKIGHFSCQLGPSCYKCPTRFDVSRCSTDTGAGNCSLTEGTYCE